MNQPIRYTVADNFGYIGCLQCHRLADELRQARQRIRELEARPAPPDRSPPPPRPPGGDEDAR